MKMKFVSKAKQTNQFNLQQTTKTNEKIKKTQSKQISLPRQSLNNLMRPYSMFGIRI